MLSQVLYKRSNHACPCRFVTEWTDPSDAKYACQSRTLCCGRGFHFVLTISQRPTLSVYINTKSTFLKIQYYHLAVCVPFFLSAKQRKQTLDNCTNPTLNTLILTFNPIPGGGL